MLAGKLVLIVAIHSLIGITRQPLNRVPYNQHMMRITQATSNPLEYLLALCRGKVKNPSQSPRSEPETITNLRSTILAAPSHLGGDNHQELQANPVVKHEHQVPLDATLKQCTWIHSQSHKDDESMMEMSGGLWLSSEGCYVNANGQESELESAMGLK